LLSRGGNAPVLVIFLGAIGGFLSMGVIGLFVGAVVLVLFHNLVEAWVDEGLREEDAQRVTAGPTSPG
jgi:predicted PurR-regulated permease PerM